MKNTLTFITAGLLLVSQSIAEVIPNARIPLTQLLNTKSLKTLRAESSSLQKILQDLENSALEKPDQSYMSIVCQELNIDGSRVALPPELHIVGSGNRWTEDGQFVRIYESYTSTGSREIGGRKRNVNTFLLTIDYSWKGARGILLVPFWAELDRSNPKEPKMKNWGVDNNAVSHISKG